MQEFDMSTKTTFLAAFFGMTGATVSEYLWDNWMVVIGWVLAAIVPLLLKLFTAIRDDKRKREEHNLKLKLMQEAHEIEVNQDKELHEIEKGKLISLNTKTTKNAS